MEHTCKPEVIKIAVVYVPCFLLLPTELRNISFHSLLSGGGVGGIITSYALASAAARLQTRFASIEIHVFEAASEFTEIGAGIGVTWRAWKVLQLLGLQDDLLKLIPRVPNDEMGA